MTQSQQLLPTFEPSEADMIQMALDMPLDRKIEKAIGFYQEYCDGAYGAFSGGKDSIVIKNLALEAGVKVDWHYNNTTIDPPELVRFIKRHHADVAWNRPEKNFFTRLAEKANPPTRMGRWCCAEYKEQGGNGRDAVIGVRISESPRRALLWKQVVTNRKTGDRIFCPIVYWTDDDVWEYIRTRRIPYCELYDQGFSRLGCIGCPLGGPAAQKKDFERWPRYEQAWRRAFQKLWDRWHGVPNRKGEDRYFEKYGSPEAFFEWWVSGGSWDGDSDEQCIFEQMMEQR